MATTNNNDQTACAGDECAQNCSDVSPPDNKIVQFIGVDTTCGVPCSNPTGTFGMSTPSTDSILQLLSRPVRIATGSLGTASGLVTSLTFTTSTLDLHFHVIERFFGFYGFRATLVFTLDVAVTPFQSHLLRLGFYPDLHEGTYPNQVIYDRNGNNGMLYHLPGVTLNTEENTTVVLKWKYCGIRDFCTLDGDVPWGKVALANLVAPSLPASDTGGVYKLFCHLEDIELFGQTIPNSLTDVVVLQSGALAMAGSLIASAYENKTISTMADRTKRFATAVEAMTTKIPLISSLAGYTRWIADIVGDSARSLGFSKALDNRAVNKMYLVTDNYYNNSDGQDASMSLGYTVEPGVVPVPGFAGTDLDEMSFAFLLSRSSLIGSFRWSTSSANGPLYVIRRDPMAWYYKSLPSNGNRSLPNDSNNVSDSSWVPSVLMYMANGFKFWRGGFRVTFTACKTHYHAGRLAITTYPSTDASLSKTDSRVPMDGVVGATKCHTVFWDIAETPSITVDVPWDYHTPYAPVGASVGTMSVNVLEKLVAPASVSPTVDIMVSVQGASDFEVAVPGPFVMYPSTATPQSGIPATEIAAATCIGEKIKSVKQIITRMNLMYTNVGFLDAGKYIPSFWRLNWEVSLPVATPRRWQYNQTTAQTYWSLCYLFGRGSTRVSIKATSQSPQSITITQARSDGFTSGMPLMFDTGSDAVIHALIPAYSPMVKTLTQGTADGPMDVNSFRAYTSHVGNVGGGAFNALLIGAGDDAYLGMFLGPPPVSYTPLRSNESAMFTSLINNPSPAMVVNAAISGNADPTPHPPPPLSRTKSRVIGLRDSLLSKFLDEHHDLIAPPLPETTESSS